MLLNLNQLRIFYTAARESSFAAASELLFITPQAVTHAIRNIEVRHQVTLFDRVGRGVKLTAEGEALFEYTCPVFEAADTLEHALMDLGARGQYELRVGATKMFARFLLSTITAFEDNHPRVRVLLRDETSREAAKGVESMAFHLAVVGRHAYSPRLRAKPLRQVEFLLAAGPTHPFAGRDDIGWKDLDRQPFVCREPGSAAGSVLRERLDARGVSPTIVLETGSLELMKRYASERGALAFLFEPDARQELAQGRLVPIPLREGPLTIELDVVYLPNTYRSPAVRAFLTTLDEAAHADWNALPQAMSGRGEAMVKSDPRVDDPGPQAAPAATERAR
jgi:LysR family transcriptional regulator, cyn operon transcriptional activator